MAEYRTGRALSGYMHLMQNANQTTTQDLGAVTELLSGDFFQPFGRSTSHQLWSSAMVITPALRGLFGIDADALGHAIRLDPHVPADWDHAVVEQLHVGESVCDLEYVRTGGKLEVRVKTAAGPAVRLIDARSGRSAQGDGVTIGFDLPSVEIAVPHQLPLPGSRTAQMKVLKETYEARSLIVELEGIGGSTAKLKLRRNQAKLDVRVQGGSIGTADEIEVKFPEGDGYLHTKLIVSW